MYATSHVENVVDPLTSMLQTPVKIWTRYLHPWCTLWWKYEQDACIRVTIYGDDLRARKLTSRVPLVGAEGLIESSRGTMSHAITHDIHPVD